MIKYVLDSSAILAALHQEPGGEKVEALAGSCVASSVNFCETLGKLFLSGSPATHEAQDIIAKTIEDIVDFDRDIAFLAAAMIHETKPFGLSLGDRACLATAQHLGLTAVTADRAWAKLKVKAKIKVIR